MAIQQALLRVFANPWLHIDEHGRPMGACMVDLNDHVADPGRRVGVRIADAEMTQKAAVEVIQGRSHEAGVARHKLHFAYATEAEVIPNTPYYRERVKLGDLFAADSLTASVCGIPFVPVAKAEADARAAAIAKFDSETGPGACAELNGGSLPPAIFGSSAPTAAPTSKRSSAQSAPDSEGSA